MRQASHAHILLLVSMLTDAFHYKVNLFAIGNLLSLFCLFRVIDGLETLDDLEKLPVNEKTFRPLTEVRIKSVTIHANPIADQSS